jgi:hypothetical protein
MKYSRRPEHRQNKHPSLIVYALILSIALTSCSSEKADSVDLVDQCITNDEVTNVSIFINLLQLSRRCVQNQETKECIKSLDLVDKFQNKAIGTTISYSAQAVGLLADRSEIIPLPIIGLLSLMTMNKNIYLLLKDKDVIYAIKIFSGSQFDFTTSRSPLAKLSYGDFVRFSGKIDTIIDNVVYLNDTSWAEPVTGFGTN